MARIGLTGAGGNVGQELLDAFDGDAHDIVPLTHSDHEEIDSEVLDITDPDQVHRKLDNLDTVIHLAGASSPDADWDTAMRVNVQGTKHVFDAAATNGIDRVVYASSNHAVGMYNAAEPGQPEHLTLGSTRPVRADDPTRPDSIYGVSKVACEGVAKYYADVYGLDVVILRIGWYMSEDELRDNTSESVEPERARFARAIWLSPRDCRNIHRNAATANLPKTPVTVNAVSRNDDRFHSITNAMRTIGYKPRDNSAEVLDE